MLTVRAIIRDGQVEFIDKVNLLGEHRILITFLEPDINSLLFSEHDHHEVMKAVSSFKYGLSEREFEVLKLMQQGLTNEQIADSLEIGNGTVRNYTSSIYEKLKVNNRTSAISKAIEVGLLE